MNFNVKKKLFYLLLSVSLTSCIDDSYKLTDSKINKDLSIFNNGISLPVGSLENISLGSFIKTEDSDILQEDKEGKYYPKGTYYILKSGTADDVEITIDETSVNYEKSTLYQELVQENNPFSDFFNLLPESETEINLPITKSQYPGLEQVIESNGLDKMNFIELDFDVNRDKESPIDISSSDIPEELKNIRKIFWNPMEIELQINIENMLTVTDCVTLDNDFRIYLPKTLLYTKETNVQTDNNGNKYISLANRKVTEIKRNKDGFLSIKVGAYGVDFGENGLEVVNNSVKFTDKFSVDGYGKVTRVFRSAPEQIGLPLQVNIEPFNITITSVEGIYDLNIDPIDDEMTIDKEELPELLKDEDAIIDAAHAAIEFDINCITGEIPFDFYIDATLTSHNKNFNSSINTKINLEPENGASSYNYIISDDGQMVEGYTPIIVENLPELLEFIPEQIKVNMTVDHPKEYVEAKLQTTKLGINYRMRAPLEFGDKLNLKYEEEVTGFHKSLKDFSVNDVIISGNIGFEIPVDAKISATPIDADGNKIDNISVTITPDTPIKKGETEFSIKLYSADKEIISDALDGIILKIELSNKSNNKQALKSTDYIKITGLKLKVAGGIIIDGNNL